MRLRDGQLVQIPHVVTLWHYRDNDHREDAPNFRTTDYVIN